MNGKTLLVTGGAGFIGSHFVEKAVKEGRDVVVLDCLTYAGHPENLEAVAGNSHFKMVLGNICDGSLVLELLKTYRVGALLNFAAESHVDRSIASPAAFVQTNVVGTLRLLEAALAYWQELEAEAKSRFRYLQVSTDEVFGSLESNGRFNETSKIEPNSPYSASKAGADHLVRAWHRTYGLPTITTHSSNNYGPRQYPEKLIPYMITCALNDRPLPVYGEGQNVRDWIHVVDHCDGIRLALEKGIPGGIYCFGGRACWTNFDLVRAVCRELDHLKPRRDGKKHETRIQFVPDRLGHDFRYAIDDSLAVRELGFKQEYKWEEGLAGTIRWYLDNGAWCQAVLRRENGGRSQENPSFGI